MTARTDHDAVSIEIGAPPARVYELVSDMTRMGEWSPESVSAAGTRRSSTVQGGPADARACDTHT